MNMIYFNRTEGPLWARRCKDCHRGDVKPNSVYCMRCLLVHVRRCLAVLVAM